MKKANHKTSAFATLRSKPSLRSTSSLQPLAFSRGFTLLELLVVISIIAILAGMVMPTFFTAKKRAREAKAKVAVKALETAFKSYLDTYKVWPDTVAEGTDYPVKDDTIKLFSMLSGLPAAVALNPQGIAFFEFESTNNLIAYDPWGVNPYKVMFDKDYDNKITVPASVGGGDVYRCVVVWSLGDPNDSDYPTKYIASWK